MEPRKDRTLLTMREVTSMFSVDESTIRRWVRQGKFPAPIKVGGTVRWCSCCVHKVIDHGEGTR